MYKRGLKLWSINTDKYYEEAKKLYQEGVFDYIELYVVPGALDTLAKWKDLHNNPLRHFVARSAVGGISFIIHAPHFAHGFNLAKKEKDQSNLEIYKEVKQFADELNAPYIIFHGGIDGDIRETARQLANFNEPRALIENKPYVALPNKMGGEFCRGYNTEEIQLVKETAKCGFCLDFGHAICAANSLYQAPSPLGEGRGEGLNLSQKQFVYEYCKNFLQFNPNMYHLTDLNDITSPYDSHLHLGTGELNFSQIFDMIPDESYVTFETVKNSKENLDDFVEDMFFLNRNLIS